jgi:hypothetical protein
MGVFDPLLPAGSAVVADGHRRGRSAFESANHGTATRERRSP